MTQINRSRSASLVEALESRQHLSAVISSVTFGGTVAEPIVTIKGIGFGAKPKAIKSSVTPLGTGADYAKDKFFFRDLTANPLTWTAGITGNYIGLTLSKYSGKLITYGIGSGLAEEVGNYSFNAGDNFEVGVNGSTAFGTIAIDGSNTIPVAAVLSPNVTKVKVPATVSAGAALKGSLLLTLANTGNAPAAGPQTITVYAATGSPDVTTGAGLTALATFTHATPLTAGSKHKFSLKFASIAPPAGEYVLEVAIKLPDGSLTTGVIAFLNVT